MSQDDYDQFFDDEERQARSLAALSVDSDPDQAARSQQLSDVTGAPAPIIAMDPEAFEKQHKTALNDQLIKENKFLQSYILDHPMAAKVSSNDWGNLDDLSQSLQKFPNNSGLFSWLRDEHNLYDGKDTSAFKSLATQSLQAMAKPSKGFEEGFGEQPFGQARGEPGKEHATPLEKATGIYSRPDDITWALSHPVWAATLGRAVGIGELGAEGLARVTNGLIGLGRENIASIFGEGTAEVFDNAAQALMDPATQATLTSVGPAGAIPEGIARGAELLGDFLKAYRVASPWVRAGQEPPAGIHPLIDEAKKAQTKADMDLLDEFLTKAAQSDTRELSSKLLANFVEQHLGQREIGISSEAIDRLYGDKRPAPDDNLLGWVPDLDQKLANAELTGSDVSIPIKDWLANVDPEVEKQLHDHIRARDGGLTLDETKIKAEPKEVGAEQIQQIRGAAGLDPSFMAGDRKVTLKRMDEARGKEVFGDQSLEQAEEVHDYDLLDENGKPMGIMSVAPRRGGKDIWVHNIQAGPEASEFYQPQYLGNSLIRDVARQLKAQYPEMERMGGYRVTGARDRAGKIDTAWIKFDEGPSGWGSVEPMRKFLQDIWEPAGHATSQVQARVAPLSLEQQAMAEAVRKELERIVPAKVQVSTVPQLKRGTTPGDIGGFYQRYLNDWPKIVVALDSPELALGIARHEAIHHLRQYGFINEREWAGLEQAAKDGNWVKKNLGDRYKDLSDEKRLEEAIAEQFRKWADKQDGAEGHPIFEKIKEFIERIKVAYKELTGKELDWDELFQKIHEGEVGRREGTVPQEAEPGRMPFRGEGLTQFAEREGEGFGLYDKGKALGVTQAHMDRMLRLIDKRNGEDLKASLRRAETRKRRESNKEWKERRTVLRDQVSNELKQRPDLALDQLFSQQKIKLDPATLSDDQKARLPKDYIQKKDGVRADDLAPYFGYTSGDALVERLGMLTEDRRRSGMSARDYFNRLTDVETDRRLNAEFGDREAHILGEATDQALSETQLNLVHEETLAHALKAGQEPKFTKEQVREMVKQSFDQQPVGSIKSWNFLQAAGQIGKKIEVAGAKGKWDEAYRLSQQRNHAVLYAKFARDYERSRAQFDRIAKQFRKREVASVPGEYTNWIHNILQRVGYPINRSIQDLAENIARQPAQTLGKFVEEYEKYHTTRDLPVSDIVKDLVDNDKRKPVDEWSHEDFKQLKSSVDVLVKAGRDEKKVIVGGEVMDHEVLIHDARQQLATFGYKPKKAELPTIAGVAYSKWPRAFVHGLESMETFMNRLSRGDPRGLFNRLFYPLADAANGKAKTQREIAKDYAALPELEDLNKLVDSPITDPLSRGTPRYGPNGSGTWPGFNRGNVIKMLLNAGNDSNWKVLAHGLGADPEDLFKWLQKNISANDIAFAEGMGDIFKKLIARYDNVQERQTGMTVEKIKLRPIQFKLKDGTVVDSQGWYHPLVPDPIRKTVWKQDAAGQWSQVAQGKRDMIKDEFFNFSVADGFTKKRTGAIYPIDLDLNVTPTTINQMIHAIHFKEVIDETQKIFGDRRFQEDVAKYYGREFSKGLIPYLKAVAGAEGVPGEAMAKANALSNQLRQNVISTYIGFNPFTVLKHGPTAAVMSAREVGLRNFASAVKSVFFQSPSVMRANRKFVLDNSEEVQRRERHWQDTIAGQGREIEGAGNLREKIIEKGSAAVAWSDMASAIPTWLASYNKHLGDGLTHGESVTLADRAVRRAHGSTAETNQPPLVQGPGDALHPWLTSVYGFFGTAMQRRIETAHKLIDAYDLGVNDREFGKATRKLSSAFGDFMTYMIWPTLVEEAVNGIGTDDHRTWGSRIISGTLMGAASSVLYIRDLIHAATTGHDPGTGMLTSFLADQNKVVRDLYNGKQAFSKQHAAKTVADLMVAAGEFTGVVPKAVSNVVRYSIDVAEGNAKPKGIKDLLLGVTKGTQKERVER